MEGSERRPSAGKFDLVIGRSAKGYLDERARARLERKKDINRIERSTAEG